MNIQGMGQAFMAYPGGMQGAGRSSGQGGFDLSSIDAQSIVDKADANEDGVLSIEETPMNEDMFSNADSDGNGELTTEEMEEMLSKGPQSMMGRGMGPMGGGPGGMMGGRGMAFDIDSILENEDSDGDGTISSEESLMPDEVFSDMDTNQDGVVTQEELAEHMSSRQEEMSGMRSSLAGGGTTQDTAMNAYQKVMDSYLDNFMGQGYSDQNLSSFLETIA